MHLPHVVEDERKGNHTGRSLKRVADVRTVAVVLGVRRAGEHDLHTENRMKRNRDKDADDLDRLEQWAQRVNPLNRLLKFRPIGRRQDRGVGTRLFPHDASMSRSLRLLPARLGLRRLSRSDDDFTVEDAPPGASLQATVGALRKEAS